MSGTSYDGVDAALINTDGSVVKNLGATASIKYDDILRAKIKKLLEGELSTDLLFEVIEKITRSHASVVEKLLKSGKLKPHDIDLLGFHGQTIYHNPQKNYTWQIGNGALLANLTEIKVISDFRSMDLARGGNGAPLVPLYHRALAQGLKKPVVFLNIGGVSNITYIGNKHDETVAFDTGPGCALVDDWVFEKTGRRYDDGGALATTGIVNYEVLNKLLENQYFAMKPPKSLDRNNFKNLMPLLSGISVADGAATLTHFSAAAIVDSMKFFGEKPKEIIVSGGGRKNEFLVKVLRNLFDGNVRLADDLMLNDKYPLDGDYIEAQAFAYLAVRCYYNLPISMPKTTGVKFPSSGGALYRV